MNIGDFNILISRERLNSITRHQALDGFFKQEDKDLLLKQLLDDWSFIFKGFPCRPSLDKLRQECVLKIIPFQRILIERISSNDNNNTILLAYENNVLPPTVYCKGRKKICQRPYPIERNAMRWMSPPSESDTSFIDLPVDILRKIFSYNTVWDLREAQLVCNKFYRAASHDSLWKNKWRHPFDFPISRYNHFPQRTQFAQYNLLGSSGHDIHPEFYKRAGFWLSNPHNKHFVKKILSTKLAAFTHRQQVLFSYAQIREETAPKGSRKRPREYYEYVKVNGHGRKPKKDALMNVVRLSYAITLPDDHDLSDYRCFMYISPNGILKISTPRCDGQYHSGNLTTLLNRLYVKEFVWPINPFETP
jgi:hypothetical protein